MTGEEQDRLAAEFVTGLVDAAEMARCEALLRSDPSFAEQVDQWRRRLSEFDETAVPVMPRADMWARIEASTGIVRPPVASRPPSRSRIRDLWDSLPLWRGVGLTAAAAALLLAAGLALVSRDMAQTPVLVAVLLSDQNRPAAIVNAFRDGRTELVPIEAIQAPAGKSLQVWTLWDRARGPVSVGLLDAMRSVDLRLEGLPATATDQLFEVTLEPEGGSPTGRPTGPILMKGNTTRAL